MISAAAILVAAALFGHWFYHELHKPIGHAKSAEYIEIPRGSSPDTIANILVREGVLRRRWPLLLYIKLARKAKFIKSGEYRFPSPISPLGVLAKLQEGEQRLSRFTVPEGWTRWDIAEALANMEELQLKDSSEALALMNDTSGVRDIDPQAPNLEGYLFPATYSFPPETKPPAIIAGMVKRFRLEWTPERATRAGALKMSPRQNPTRNSRQ